MKTKMTKFTIIFATLILFAASLYLAFVQGGVSGESTQAPAHFAASVDMSPIVYTGVQAHVANFFTTVLNVLMSVFGNSILLSIVVLALLVELVLLYPSVRIQLKQKKIHVFHKKLVDRFNSGELKSSETKHELNLLYAVNEKVHARGAVFVALQLMLFLAVLWGLNLIVKVPYLVHGSWNVLNFSLLSTPANYTLP